VRSPGSERRKDRLAVLGLLVATGVVTGDLLLDPERVVSHSLGDTFRYFLSARAFGFRELAAGNLPLWNPHLFSGTPFVGGFQSALLYPPNWIHLLLPTEMAIDLEVAVHVFLLGAFQYAWARSRRLGHGASLFAAAMLMFGAPVALRVLAGQLTVLATLAWTPLLFLSIDRLLERPTTGWCLVGVLATAMQALAGYPASFLIIGVTAALYALLSIRRAPQPLRSVALLGVVGIAPLFLGAVQLWTGLEVAAETVRGGGTSYAWVTQFSLPPENLLLLLAPAFFGDLVHFPYWGRAFIWDASPFVGVVGLALAALGATRGAPEQRRFLLLGLALGFVVVALGAHTRVYELVYTFVPGFAYIRAPSKFLFVAALFLALLAGLGAQQLLEGGRGAGRVAAALGALAALALGASAFLSSRPAWLPELARWSDADPDLLYRLDPSLHAAATAQAVRSLRLAAALCAATAALLFGARRSRRAGWALIGLGIVELVVFARIYRGSFELSERAHAAVDALYRELPPEARVFDLAGGRNPLRRDRCMDVGGHVIWGYEAVVLRRYAELIGEAQPDRVPLAFRTSLHPPRLYHPIFAMLRCSAVVTPPGPPRLGLDAGRRPFASDQLRRRSAERDEIVRVDGALPRFLFVTDYRVEANPEAALGTLVGNGFDARRTILLEQEPSVRPSPGDAHGTVTVLDESTDHLTLDIDVDRNALLLVTDAYSRGWRSVSLLAPPPQDYRVVPANHALRALALRAGQHRIRLEYAPQGYRLGRWVSLGSAALYLAAVALWLARRRRSAPSRS
jgi:hypothetical protein